MTTHNTLMDSLKTVTNAVNRRLDAIEQAANARDARIPIEGSTASDGGVDLHLKHIAGWDVPSDNPTPHETVTLEMADMDLLGTVAGHSYLRRDDREIRLDAEVLPVVLNDKLRRDQAFVHELHWVKGRIEQFGEQLRPSVDHEEDRYFRATYLPAGSYEAAVARQARLEANRQPRRTPILSPRPHGWPLGRPLLQWIGKRGIELSMVDGRLLVTTERRSTPDLMVNAINDHAPLIVGWLTDAPVSCWRSKCSAEAVTVLVGGAPACAEHAR